MPFDLNQAALRLRALHGDPLAFRRALLDLAFASGCAVSEQAVALENGDAVALRIASGEQPAQAFAVVDLDPPGRGVWSPERDSLGGPLLAQTWAVALHALLQQRAGPAWALTYTRGPALGVPTWVQERVADDGRPTIQLAPCPSQPSSGDAQDGVIVTLRRAWVSRRRRSMTRYTMRLGSAKFQRFLHNQINTESYLRRHRSFAATLQPSGQFMSKRPTASRLR